jgi:threonine/homoserine/homoserine lactone efflux protein
MTTVATEGAMFFVAFLPNFVSPNAEHFVQQMLVLGLIFLLQSIIIFCAIGNFSCIIGRYIQSVEKNASLHEYK